VLVLMCYAMCLCNGALQVFLWESFFKPMTK